MTVGANHRPAVAHALLAALCDALQRNFLRDSQIGRAGRLYGSPPEETVEDAVSTRSEAETQIAEEAAQIHVAEQVVVGLMGDPLESTGIVHRCRSTSRTIRAGA
jgi:hypothetical protein